MYYYRKGIPFHPSFRVNRIPFHPFEGYRFTQNNLSYSQGFQQLKVGETVSNRVLSNVELSRDGLDEW